MPRGNGTGPMGMGAMTGRGAGYCAGYGVPGYANPAVGRGLGMAGRMFAGGGGGGGGGGGRGHRHQYYATGQPGWVRFGGVAPSYGSAAPSYGGAYGMPAPMDPEMEKQALKNQAEALKADMDVINKRLEDIEAASREG